MDRDDGSSRAWKPALAMEAEEFRRLGYRAVDMAIEHMTGMRDGAVFTPMSPQEREALLAQPLPEAGVAPDKIVSQFQSDVLPYPMGNGHPRFFGWINSPPAPIGVLAELLAASLDPSCAGGDHAAIYLERCAVRWLMELIGFPTEGSMGLLVSGGSMASLTGLAAARHWAAATDGWNVRSEGLHANRKPLTLYVTEEGHSCMRKAAELLGLGSSAIHTVPLDDQYKMDVAALRDAIRRDREEGRRPFCVGTSAGTVNTGAIDPLDAIADVCDEEGLWLHVDGAYGAVGVLDPSTAHRYAGIERARSVALDPHKWLNVPVECGCVLVRDGQLLRDTFSLVPPYLRTEEGKGFGGLPWFSEYGFQQSRGFRALKLWMTLQYAGRDGLAAHVAHHNALARRLAELIDEGSDFERLAPVELSIVCFRYGPPALRGDTERLNALNKAIMETIQTEGETFVTSAMLHGRYALRACIIHYGTTEGDIEHLIDVVRRVGRRLAENA